MNDSNVLAKYDANDYLPSAPVMERITNHLKVALNAQDAPTPQVLNAARVCAKFNLEPSHEVHLYHAWGNNWTLDIGIRAYQTSAERWERDTGDKLIFDEPRLLTEAEMIADLGEQYDPGKTVGVEIRCVKMSQIQAFRLMGREVPMTPYRGYHFAGRLGRKRNGEWRADKQPGSTETLEGQARRRAKKKAYMNEVGLHAPPVTHQSWRLLEQSIDNVLIEQEHKAEDDRLAERHTTVALERDEDGDIIFSPSETTKRPPESEIVDGEFHDVDDITVADAPDDTAAHLSAPEENPFEDDADQPTPDEAAILAQWDGMTIGDVKQWCVNNGYASNIHSAGNALETVKGEVLGDKKARLTADKAEMIRLPYLRNRMAAKAAHAAQNGVAA